MRHTGPRNRLARREEMDLGLKTVGSKSHANLLKKLNVPPGQHGTRRRRKLSEHAHQLREKQKLRYMFGLSEKQLKKYYDIASRRPGNTAFYLAQYLERRLDNVIYRLGLSPTRASARQLVTHGHVQVNKKQVNVPSYQTKIGDTISFGDEKVGKIPYIEKMLTDKDVLIPKWLERKGPVGRLAKEPESEDLDKLIKLRLVIEFYSR